MEVFCSTASGRRLVLSAPSSLVWQAQRDAGPAAFRFQPPLALAADTHQCFARRPELPRPPNPHGREHVLRNASRSASPPAHRIASAAPGIDPTPSPSVEFRRGGIRGRKSPAEFLCRRGALNVPPVAPLGVPNINSGRCRKLPPFAATYPSRLSRHGGSTESTTPRLGSLRYACISGCSRRCRCVRRVDRGRLCPNVRRAPRIRAGGDLAPRLYHGGERAPIVRECHIAGRPMRILAICAHLFSPCDCLGPAPRRCLSWDVATDVPLLLGAFLWCVNRIGGGFGRC